MMNTWVIQSFQRLLDKVSRYGSYLTQAPQALKDRFIRVANQIKQLKSQPKFKVKVTDKAHPRKDTRWYGYEQHDFVVPPRFGIHTLEVFKKDYSKAISNFIAQQLALKGALKIQAGIVIKGFLRNDPHDWGCTVDNQRILNIGEIPAYLNLIFKDFQEKLDGTSYFNLTRVTKLSLHISKYEPLSGSSYVELPELWNAKKAIVNVKNSDNKCALWALISALFPVEKNPQRITNYIKYEDRVDFSGIEFPVKVADWSRIEAQNQHLLNGRALDIYWTSGDRKTLSPLKISNNPSRERIQLLLYSPKPELPGHYVWVKSLDRLVNKQGHHGHTCHRCLTTFTRPEALTKHSQSCIQFEPMRVRMPLPGSTVKFKNFYRENKIPVVAYSDFECPNLTSETWGGKGKKRKRTEHTLQEPGSWAITLAIQDGVEIKRLENIPTYRADWSSVQPWFYYCGADASDQFLKTAKEISRCCYPTFKFHKFKEVKDIQWTPEDKMAFKAACLCEYCKCEFSKDDPKVPDHDHLTGAYRGALHQSCNLSAGKQESRRFIPFVFHNLKGYDGHHIIRAIGADANNEDTLEVIATSGEKYLSFTIKPDDSHSFDSETGKRRLSVPIRFIDSLQFQQTSLDKLIANVVKNPNRERRGLSGLKEATTQRKGVFPYDWDWWSHLEDSCLPPKDAFSTKLSGEITDEDYEYAQRVWATEGCQTFRDYHDLYLRVDVGGLHDAFETFRSLCKSNYGLDPAYYYGLPGYGWDCMLKETGVELPLLTDPDMYQMFERGIRGGISVQTKRYAKATEDKHIQYFDANNLYGHGMCRKLPCGDFFWYCPDYLWSHLLKHNQVPEDGEYEVDKNLPPSHHDEWNEYPDPEKMVITEGLISPKSRELLQGKPFIGGEKLVGHLGEKKNIVINGKLLNYLLERQGAAASQGAAVGTSIVATTVAYSAIVGTPYFPSPAQNAGPWSGWAPTAGFNCIKAAISCTSALASSGNASTFFCFPSTVGSTITLYSPANAANCQSQSAYYTSLLGTAVTGYQCNTSNCNGPPANPTPASSPTTSSAILIKPAAGLVATAIVAMFI